MAGLPSIWGELDRGVQFGSLRPLLRQIDELFNDVLPNSALGAEAAPTARTLNPNIELQEGADSYLLTVDVPGIAKEDLNIEVQAGRLVISGERKSQHEVKSASGYAQQRSVGRFQRSFILPEGIQGEHLEAHHRDGVLTVAIPKPTNLKATKVKIGEGKSGFLKSFLGDKGEKKASDESAEQVKLAN